MWTGGYADYWLTKVICDARRGTDREFNTLSDEGSADNDDEGPWEVECDKQKWEDWETMHTNVLWYDTVGCKSSGHQVDPFATAIKPIKGGQWFKDNNYAAGVYDTDGGQTLTKYAPVNTLSDSKWNRIDYSSDIVPGSISSIRNTQKDVSIWLRRLKLEVADTCDIDCHARGSGMSIVATLNTISLAIIALNAFIMILGTWRPSDRILSAYCTIFACIFQFCVLMASAGLLFSPYARLCGFSTVRVGNFPVMSLVAGKDWMMMDDYWTMVGLWAV
jgi:hypothetical protein